MGLVDKREGATGNKGDASYIQVVGLSDQYLDKQ